LPPSPPAFLDCLSQKVFDLAVDAAQFVLRPGFQFGPELRIDSKQKSLAPHEPSRSGVECAGINHRMDFGFTAQHGHEIANHGGFALIVKCKYLFVG